MESALQKLGLHVVQPIPTQYGDEIGVVAIVFDGDQFILYDGDNRLFYDPGSIRAGHQDSPLPRKLSAGADVRIALASRGQRIDGYRAREKDESSAMDPHRSWSHMGSRCLIPQMVASLNV
jgi:hypothetical protein